MKKKATHIIFTMILLATALVALFCLFETKGVYASGKKYQKATNKLENAGLESMVRKAFKKEMFLEKAENGGWILYVQAATNDYTLSSDNVSYLTKRLGQVGEFSIYGTYIPEVDLSRKFTIAIFVQAMNAKKNFNFRIINRADVSEVIPDFREAVSNKEKPMDGRRYEFLKEDGSVVTNSELEINDYSKIKIENIPTKIKIYNYKNEAVEDSNIKIKYILSYKDKEQKYSTISDLKTAITSINSQEVAYIQIKTVVVDFEGKEKQDSCIRTYKYNATVSGERSLNEVDGIGKEKLTKMQKGIIALLVTLSICAIVGLAVGIPLGMKKKKQKTDALKISEE